MLCGDVIVILLHSIAAYSILSPDFRSVYLLVRFRLYHSLLHHNREHPKKSEVKRYLLNLYSTPLESYRDASQRCHHIRRLSVPPLQPPVSYLRLSGLAQELLALCLLPLGKWSSNVY